METRSIARSHTVYSVKLRCGGYALLQTLDVTCRIAVFDEFRDDNDWRGFNPSKGRVLFCCSVIKNFFRCSQIEKVQSVSACKEIVFPDKAISLNEPIKFTLWKGTERQMDVLCLGGDIALCTTTWSDGRPKLKYRQLSLKDYDKVKHLELTSLRGYPELNERLSICCELGRNVDPKKEIAFQRPLPPEFEAYAKMLSGFAPVSQFGY